MWLINNAMRQNEIHSMLIYGNDNAANINTPNYESHMINISRAFHLH